MATQKPRGTRVNTIHCDICGEDYADIYRSCPFCEGIPPTEDGEDEESASRGSSGKRLSTNSRGGGYGRGPSPMRIIGIIISLALIIAAICIVVSIVRPMLSRESEYEPEPSPSPVISSDNPDPIEPDAQGDITSPAPDIVPVEQTATGFTLDKKDFTLSKYAETYQLSATFTPAGGTGTVTYASSDTSIASVDETGLVTGLNKGTVTITASMPGAEDQTCVVRCSFTAPAGVSGAVGALALNNSDITIKIGETVRLQVSTSVTGTATWSSSNPSVATVASDGTVTAVGTGTTTITCTVDGKIGACIVRCK